MPTEMDVFWEQDIANQKGMLLHLKHLGLFICFRMTIFIIYWNNFENR